MKVKSTQKPVDDFLLISFDKPGLDYTAGQHLTLLVEIGHRILRRSYSLCSLPGDPYPQIALRELPNGEVSRWLFKTIQPGSLLQSLPPSGRFTLKLAPVQVFFAAGSGITPIYALIRQLLQYTSHKATLYYSEKSPDRCLFYQELQNLATQYPNRLKIHWHFSRLVDQNTHLNGRLNQFILERAFAVIPNKEQLQFYLCGPMAYMRMIRIALLFMGYEEDQIKRENFASEGIPMAQKSSVRTPFEVNVQLGSKNYRQSSEETILKAAMANQISLPYSCENGQCGTCALKLTKGKVLHRLNEVLTEKEIEAGYFLSCTALPDSPELIVE
ncbi:MAG: flavin reductase family protein [Bacteroidia bacterium]